MLLLLIDTTTTFINKIHLITEKGGFIMGLFKKKKKAELEIPPSPKMGEDIPKPAAEKMEIPDVFHEIKFSGEDVSELAEQPTEKPIEAKSQAMFEAPIVDIPEMPELPDIPEIPNKTDGPIFVKSRDYQEVIGKIGKIKDNVQHTEEIFKRMNEIKNEKDKVFTEWKRSLEDIQRKLIYVEKSLFEG